jgi:hypothetical protein
MFRARSTPRYCAQRTSAALIISEATQVSMQGQGYAWTPGIHRRRRAASNPDDPSTCYGGGAKGYTDCPTLAQERGEQPWPRLDERWR